MVSPRERPRTTRRRIAGERTRPSAGGPAAAPPTEPTEPGEPGEPTESAGPVQAPVEEKPAADAQPAAGPRTVEEPSEKPVEQQADGRPTAEAAGRSRPRLTVPWLGAWLGDDDAAGPPNWVLAVLAGLLVAALALDGFVVWREISHRQAEEDAARAMHSAVVQAPSVAEQAAQALLSYRYDQLPQEVAEARKYVTDDYAPNYVNTIRKLVADSAANLKVTVQAKVLASGVSEAGPRRADVLLFVDQTTTSAAEAPKTALNRVVFTMVPRDGGWKVAEIQAF